eukprot:scaffold6122_cov91-Skeletonema_dohrnii-CCMP3373.AAC.3
MNNMNQHCATLQSSAIGATEPKHTAAVSSAAWLEFIIAAILIRLVLNIYIRRLHVEAKSSILVVIIINTSI